MEIIIEFLNSHLTILYIAGAVIIALKILVAVGLKGFSFVPVGLFGSQIKVIFGLILITLSMER